MFGLKPNFHAVLVNLAHYITGFRLWLNQWTFPKISCYAASTPHLQQLPVMTLSKMSLWQASFCKIQVSSLPCQPSLSQPASPCPVCCCCYSSLTFLSVFGFVLLPKPCLLSVFLYAGWLHHQDDLTFLVCFAWFFKPDIPVQCIWCHLLFFEWITLLLFLVKQQDGLHGMTGLNSCYASSASDTFA